MKTTVALCPGKYDNFTGYVNCLGNEGYAEEADFTIIPDYGIMSWRGGTWTGDMVHARWLGGVFKGGSFIGQWFGGEWRDGVCSQSIWHGGVWQNGLWKNGRWEGGEWNGGT